MLDFGARGKTIVNNAKYILRGYENLEKKLNSLGAKIELKDIKRMTCVKGRF